MPALRFIAKRGGQGHNFVLNCEMFGGNAGKENFGLEKALRRFAEAGLSLLFPEICQFCRACSAGVAEGFVCAACRKRFRFVEHPFCDICGSPFEGEGLSAFRCGNCDRAKYTFQAARSAVVVNEFSLEVIHHYKYYGMVWLDDLLADLLWKQLGALELRMGWDFVVPVPLHSTRLREREFNQAEKIGQKIAERLDVPLAANALKRIAPTVSQTTLPRRERIENVRGAFAAGKRAQLRDKRVMVVDDVFTTGATTDACARVLKGMGASEIWVWTVARTLMDRR